eukprot:TRINITY_DN10794_c0_g1_i1.p1 TRINITY_DN10794_c0_g1~~TRINITY_DN10794_c0_g1_i1.p1  ORF type:complete len:258 (-),score=43.79 TRINITY_DN10794_c0_g1_i1:157-858(-)
MADVSRSRLTEMFESITSGTKDVPLETVLYIFTKLGWQLSVSDLEKVNHAAASVGNDSSSLNYERLLEWLYPTQDEQHIGLEASALAAEDATPAPAPPTPRRASVQFACEDATAEEATADDAGGSEDGEKKVAPTRAERSRSRSLTTKAVRKPTLRDSMDIFSFDSFLLGSFYSEASGGSEEVPRRSGTLTHFEMPDMRSFVKAKQKRSRSLSPTNLRYAEENYRPLRSLRLA